MLAALKGFRLSQAIPRLGMDLVIVHLSAILALLGTFAYQITTNETISRNFLGHLIKVRYLDHFWLLSIAFPIVFLLSGFYTQTRTYAARYKWWTILRGCVLASLVYIFASILLIRSSVLPRSALLLFPGLLIGGVLGVRLLNYWLEIKNLAKTTPAMAPPNGPAKPVLVIGGAGYIGAIILRKLLARGLKVRCLDSLVYGDSAIRDILNHPNLEFIKGDCRNIQDVVRSMSNAGSVIHLAAIVGDPACAADDKNAVEINFAATRMIMEIAKANSVERFLFASSCSVYGASDAVMDERSATVPVSLYGETKIKSEQVLLDAASDTFSPVILRFATVFGLAPRPRFDLVVNLLTAKAFQEGTITIFNGEQWRPFIHAADIAEAVCQVLQAPLAHVRGEIFNVGDDRQNYTLTQIADLIGKQFPGTRVERVENSDRRNYRVSFQKIRQRIGFECSMSVDDGIREIRTALERQEIIDYKDPLYSNVNYLKGHGLLNSERELDSHVMAAFATLPKLQGAAGAAG